MSKKDQDYKDFTESNYEFLLKKISNKCIFYDEINENNNFILWRHDVDFSVNRAFALSKIEKDNNIKSTYFFQLNSSFYNVFEGNIKNLIYKILSCGHKMGLHFDPTQYVINSENDLQKFLLYEKKIIEGLFNVEVGVFSFHNPTEYILKYDKYKYSDMINTYSTFFKKHVNYCSDSNGYWRYNELEDFLNKSYKKVQVLTHPGWWQNKPMHPRQRIFRAIYGRSEFQLKMYDDMLLQNNRKNQGANSNILFLLKYFLNDNFVICDYLWNKLEFELLFVKLFYLHELQINEIYNRNLLNFRSNCEDRILQSHSSLSSTKKFKKIVDSNLCDISDNDIKKYIELFEVKKIVTSNNKTEGIHHYNMENCCISLCNSILLLNKI